MTYIFATDYLRVFIFIFNFSLVVFVMLNFRVSKSARVNVYGLPFIRVMTKIFGISGKDLIVKCPVAGYPIDKIQWERGEWSILVFFGLNTPET